MSQPKRLRVMRPDLLQELVERFAERFETRREAAEALDITETHLHRLLNGQGGETISRTTVERLWSGLRIRDQKRIDDAFLSDEGADLVARHHEWLRRVLRPYRYQVPRGKSRAVSISSLAEHAPLVETTSRPASRDAGTYAAAIEAVFNGLPLRAQRAIMEFEGQMRASGHDRLRILLAIVRILEPLLAHDETQGVERGAEELAKAGQLGAYLKAAIARELVLLDRPPEIDRAQDLATR